MSTKIAVHPDSVDVELTGIDAVLALRHRLHLAASEIEAASVAPVKELKRKLGIRIGGGYLPGAFATGNFTSRGGVKGRQFWSVYRDPEALVIDVRHGGLRRVVLQTPDRAELAERINALAGG